MDYGQKYSATGIPRREDIRVRAKTQPYDNRPAGGGTQAVQIGFFNEMPAAGIKVRSTQASAGEISLADRGFAEIEYEFNPSGEKPDAPIDIKSQPIIRGAADPLREKFYAMRSLASGNPFARNDAGIFYRQAKFMEDFSDNFSGHSPFSMYYPCYQHMGYEQLRTYFTWRGKIRDGEFGPVSPSYIFLYIYELLAGIGTGYPGGGLEKLVALWDAYGGYEPKLNAYMPGWIKDYHIYYGLQDSFTGFAAERGMSRYYPELSLFNADSEDCFSAWSGISDYDVTKSKFFTDGNDGLFIKCFSHVLGNLPSFCAKLNVRVEALFSLGSHPRFHWYPFRRALFYSGPGRSERVVKMPGGEVYYCKNGRWTVNTVPYDSDRKELAGYFIKKIEACLRSAVKYKYKLKTGSGIFVYEFEKLGIPFGEFDRFIEGSVAEFFRNLTRTVVTVDRENLARIRVDALITQNKLVVTDDLEDEVMPVSANDDIVADAGSGPQTGWDTFKEALSGAERGALAIIIKGGGGIREYADGRGIMLEVLADGINEKAIDHIGDYILEMDDDILIYGEYAERVAEMCYSSRHLREL